MSTQLIDSSVQQTTKSVKTSIDNKSDEKTIQSPKVSQQLSSQSSQELLSNPIEPTINVPLNELSSSPKTRSDSISSGFLDWFANNEFISKMAEKAKNSMDTMITTLDPGMKQIICKFNQNSRFLSFYF